MNQLGGVEPGHSMFGGRWNRGDGLLRQFELKQLQEVVKEDENNGIIIPSSNYLVKSSYLLKSSYALNTSLSGIVPPKNLYFECSVEGKYLNFKINTPEFCDKGSTTGCNNHGPYYLTVNIYAYPEGNIINHEGITDQSTRKEGTSIITTFKVKRSDNMRFREVYPEVFTGTKHGWPSCSTCEWSFHCGAISPGYLTIQ
jgi:hypothetical protein